MPDDFFDDLNDLAPVNESDYNIDSSGEVESGLSKLASLVEDINHDLRPETILNRVISASIELTGAERGFLVLVSENGEWKFSVAKNMETDIDDAESAVSRTIIRKVLESRRPLLVNDVVGSSDLTKQQSIARMQVRSVMGAPLISKGKLLGAAYVDTSKLAGVFDQTSLVLFETFVHLAAVALENARLIKLEVESKAKYKELQEYLATILKSQPHGLLILDENCRIEYANPQAKLFLGEIVKPGIKLCDAGCFDLVLMDEIKQALKLFLEEKREYRDQVKLGGRTLAYSFFNVQKDREGRLQTGMVLEDISAQKVLERKLIESEKRSTVNQLAGGIAHEINNSLQPVKGRVELLSMRLERKGVEIDEGINKDLTTISALTERIEKIAKNLRHLTKPAAPNLEQVDLKRLITSTVELLDTTTGSLRGFSTDSQNSEFALILNIADNLAPITGDSHGLESAFINIILNSVHAIREKKTGHLRISAFPSKGGIEVAFADTGTGIHPEVLPHIFEPYYTTKGETGTGL
ncbi:GAF domain-containing protein, partial [bacterium]|nr:GAF domain-containing protein [bacterium]